jgi:hypothetical protein
VELGWTRRDYIVDEENPSARMLSAEELEQDREREREIERERGHVVNPVSVGGNWSGDASSGH